MARPIIELILLSSQNYSIPFIIKHVVPGASYNNSRDDGGTDNTLGYLILNLDEKISYLRRLEFLKDVWL
jgi:hypothetical protein